MDPAWSAVLLVAAALCAVWLAGFLLFRGPEPLRIGAAIGRFGAERHGFVLFGDLRERVPVERQVAFMTAGGAHSASYFVGFAGGVVLIVKTWRCRARLTSSASMPGT